MNKWIWSGGSENGNMICLNRKETTLWFQFLLLWDVCGCVWAILEARDSIPDFLKHNPEINWPVNISVTDFLFGLISRDKFCLKSCGKKLLADSEPQIRQGELRAKAKGLADRLTSRPDQHRNQKAPTPAARIITVKCDVRALDGRRRRLRPRHLRGGRGSAGRGHQGRGYGPGCVQHACLGTARRACLHEETCYLCISNCLSCVCARVCTHTHTHTPRTTITHKHICLFIHFLLHVSR